MTAATPGQRLREKRREAGLSPAQLGERAAAVAGRPKPISPSAVRNQENGTNGIPFTLIDAYSQVLDLPPGWLLYGISIDEMDEPDPDGPAAPELLNDILTAMSIPVRGIVSSGWHESTPAPLNSIFDAFLQIDVEGYTNEGLTLSAYKVADGSLHPHYRLGEYLITAPARDVDIRNGDHVIVWSSDEHNATVLETLREVRARPGSAGRGADLIALGTSQQPPLDWFQSGVDARRIYPTEVVVATYRPTPPAARGRLVVMPTWMREAVKNAADERDQIDAESAEEIWRRHRPDKSDR